MLPADWQDRLSAMIRGQAAPDAAWLAGGPGLSPEQQLAIYREQFLLRLGHALRENYPALAAYWGDQAEARLMPVLAQHPPDSWSLDHAGLALPEWLLSQGAAPEEVELAQLDRNINLGFSAAEAPPLNPEALGPSTPLRLSPPTRLLRLTRSVHVWRAMALGGQSPDPIEAGDFPVVTFRQQRRMRHLVLPADAWILLRSCEGRSLVEALGLALESGADPAQFGANVGAWMRTFAERGLLTLA